MNINSDNSLAVFKWLATVLSVAITLPGCFDSKYAMVFILATCVFIFGKLVDNIEGIVKHNPTWQIIICIIGTFIGVVAIGCCFYYISAISNATQIIAGETVHLTSDVDMKKYPFFSNSFLSSILFWILCFYVFEDTLLCGCEIAKYIKTKRKVSFYKKEQKKLTNIFIL